MTGLEKRLALVIEDHDNGLHDSIEETVEFILQALRDPGGRDDYGGESKRLANEAWLDHKAGRD